MCRTWFPNCVNLSSDLEKLDVPVAAIGAYPLHSVIELFNIDLYKSDTFLYTTLLIVCGDGTLYAQALRAIRTG